MKEGTISNCIRLAIEKGFDPISAYTMASYNGAMMNRLYDRGAIAPNKIADIIADENIPVICGPVICDRCKPEMQALELENAAVMQKNGVQLAICTDHTVIPIQYLPLSAKAAVKGGLGREEALKAITINAAAILGIDNEVGSIEEGKQADLLIYKKVDYPLDLLCEPTCVMIDGKII